jgi:hypothetical protein
MTSRTVRVCALKIIYPEGSHASGWYPPKWDDPKYLKSMPRKMRRQVPRMKREFRWPKEKLYLSRSGANSRAWLLRAYGAEVEVLGSDPVTWHVFPGTEPRTWPLDDEPLDQAFDPDEAGHSDDLAEAAAREFLRTDGAMPRADEIMRAALPPAGSDYMGLLERRDVQDR